MAGAGAPPVADAHEFWIEPESHLAAPGGTVVADLKVGQEMAGSVFPYLSNRFVGLRLHDGDGARDIAGTEGDLPAIRVPLGDAGIAAIAYHSTADRLEFDDWAEFVEYLDYEGNGWAAEAHLVAGRPRDQVSERYIRCAKALIKVGDGAAEFRDPGAGLPLEIVALEDPFRAGAESIRVRLVWNGSAVDNLQISIFEGGVPVRRTVVRTDADGTARVALRPGRRYLLNAVRLEQLPDSDGEDWQSHWASLTFETPEE